MVFSDVRTGKSKAEKYVIDVSQKVSAKNDTRY